MKRIMLLAMAGLLAVIMGVSSWSRAHQDRSVTVLFRDASGLFAGNDVGVLGVPIGRITSIRPDGNVVRVQLSVDPSIRLPEAVGAVIVSRSVATDRYVELTPRYTSGPTLADNAVIPANRTRVPVDFDQVLASLGKLSSAVAGSSGTTGAVTRLLEDGRRYLAPNAEGINQALTKLAAASDTAVAHQGDALAALKAANGLTARFATHSDLIKSFIADVAATSQLLASQRANFSGSITAIQKAIDVLAAASNANRAGVQGTLSEASQLADVLLGKKAQLAEILEVLPLALSNLLRTKTPGGILVRVPLGDALGTPLSPFCQKLAPGLCDAIGTNPLWPFLPAGGVG